MVIKLTKPNITYLPDLLGRIKISSNFIFICLICMQLHLLDRLVYTETREGSFGWNHEGNH